MEAYIQTEIREKTAFVAFFHPKGNCFPTRQLNALIKEIEILRCRAEIKSIILHNEGEKVFSSGASFDELLQLTHEQEAFNFFSGFGRLILALKQCPKIIIGVAKGKAVGGGVGILSACDYVFATTVSSLRLSELSIGIGPFVIAPATIRKIGLSAFSEMSLSPTEWKDAQWAREKGLYNMLCNDASSAMAQATDYAMQLNTYSTAALEKLKQMLWEGTEHWENLFSKRAKLSGDLSLSPETRARLLAFKRK